MPTITKSTINNSHRTHRLPSSLTENEISARLGFEPETGRIDGDKVTVEWGCTIDGHPAAIWDYRGARWSAYDPKGVLAIVFPELTA